MISISAIYSVSIIVFLAIPVLQLIINPSSITEDPKADDTMSVVDKTASQAVALFAIVLVIIQFILDNGDKISTEEMKVISLLSMCAGFLMLTFAFEMIGGLRLLVFHLQLTALRYSGLLLFTSLLFLLNMYPLNGLIYDMYLIFVVLVWSIWIIHEAHFLFINQRKIWKNKDATYSRWIRKWYEESN